MWTDRIHLTPQSVRNGLVPVADADGPGIRSLHVLAQARASRQQISHNQQGELISLQSSSLLPPFDLLGGRLKPVFSRLDCSQLRYRKQRWKYDRLNERMSDCSGWCWRLCCYSWLRTWAASRGCGNLRLLQPQGCIIHQRLCPETNTEHKAKG